MGRRRGKFDAARPTEYLIVDLFFANQLALSPSPSRRRRSALARRRLGDATHMRLSRARRAGRGKRLQYSGCSFRPADLHSLAEDGGRE